ncbi:MAG: hypothetical protein K0B01_07785 [Syntrophobacterales bacterium]|nr:hypothetical protein [Syntrophobacterales bacterium]
MTQKINKNNERVIIPEIDDIFLHTTMQQLDIPTILNEIYTSTLPMIRKIIKQYITLDVTTEQSDFLQQAYLALYDAVIAYRRDENGTKFSTVFVWYLQKSFEKLCPMNEKQVEIIYPDGGGEIVSYKKFLKIKRSLSRATATRVVNRYISLDQLMEDDGEKKSNVSL